MGMKIYLENDQKIYLELQPASIPTPTPVTRLIPRSTIRTQILGINLKVDKLNARLRRMKTNL